ncbi:MAG: glutathione S-transferase N-terminal domain-containing protein [Granulosicoccus sp.]|nr:glutathione S-transferase N-terminal domain-containing protein [Granulosicoccus sp.]
MKIYGTENSPFVRHCRIALLQQGFEFEFIDADRTVVATLSPTQKMPYFTDGTLTLSDSSSIVKYVREKAGEQFLPELANFERYTMANTVMDTLINYRVLLGEGYTSTEIKYMGKQLKRARSGLEMLNRDIDVDAELTEDSTLRTACLVDWGLFRECIDLDGLDNLARLLANARTNEQFNSTAPPRG